MKRKGTILIFAICIVLLFSVPAAAATATKTATLNYSDIKITFNGQSVTPKDANGNVVEPFIIDGTTYLPVRAVANALGLDVQWDSSAKTVILSSGSAEAMNAAFLISNSIGSTISTVNYSDIKITLNGQVITPMDASGNVVEPFIIDGTTYLPVRAVADALGLDVQWDSSSKTVILSSSSTSISQSSGSSSSEYKKADVNWLNQYNYVASSESNRYHYPHCRWTSEINEDNLIAFDSVEEAEAAGYIPCKVCQ